MISPQALSAEVRNIRCERARPPIDTSIEPEPVPFEHLPPEDRQAWEDTAEAVRRLTDRGATTGVDVRGIVGGVPPSVKDERAMLLLRMARECIGLALAIAPNWKDSKLTVEDLRELEQWRRRLLALEIDA